MLFGLLQFIDMLLYIVFWIIIAQVVVSWLLAFNVLNMSNRIVATIASTLHQITEPMLRPIRRILPSFSGLDFSPIVLFLAIEFVRRVFLIPAMHAV